MLLAAAAHNSFKEVRALIPIPLLLVHFHIIEMRGVSPEAETRLEGRVGKRGGRARPEPRRESQSMEREERRGEEMKEERWNQGDEEERWAVKGQGRT